MPMVLCCWLNKENQYITKFIKYAPVENHYYIGYVNRFGHELILMYAIEGMIFYPITDTNDMYSVFRIYEKNCEILMSD